MKREEFEAKYGRLPVHATYLDLDDPDVNPQALTCGWSDDQIKARPKKAFEQDIAQGQAAITKLEETVEAERQRLVDVQTVYERKLKIGGV